MTLLRPSRRELIGGVPLLLGAAALPSRLIAAEPPPLSFFALGDWGRNGRHNQWEVARRMDRLPMTPRPHCIVSTGDNFYTLGVSSVDDPKWQGSFERIYGEEKIPWYAVLGNHDYGGSIQAQLDYASRPGRWNMPHFSETAGPLTVRMPPAGATRQVDFFFVDTVAWIGKESFPFAQLGSSITYEQHKQQIAKLVAALRKSDAHYKFVFGHHGVHSVGPHGGHPRLKELDDVMRAHGVTAYVHGHDHCLYYVTHNGMNYICSGAGSQILPTFKGAAAGCVYGDFCDSGADDAEFPRWRSYFADAGFAVFSLTSTGWEFEFVTLSDRQKDMPRRFSFGEDGRLRIEPPRWLRNG
jgi:tartrate-resistant acid phosphatase type 5